MKRGGYPPGVFEHTRGAPWNEYATIVCRACGRFYYPNERPRGARDDDETGAPETAHGNENDLCATCETETNVCTECHATETVADGAKPRAVDGCAECRAEDVSETVADVQCNVCGARRFSILGTLGNCVWYRCRNCGADIPGA